MESSTQDGERPGKRASFVEFAAFLILGGVAAITNLIARYFFNFVMPFELAVVIAYGCGMIVAFVLFGRLLFQGSEGRLFRRIIRFTQVNILGAFLAWLVSVAMARYVLPAIGWDIYPLETAHLFGVSTPAIASYFLHKHYTFV